MLGYCRGEFGPFSINHRQRFRVGLLRRFVSDIEAEECGGIRAINNIYVVRRIASSETEH